MKTKPKSYEPKPLFLERMQKLLGKDTDFQNYVEILEKSPEKSIRANKLKISPKELRKKLEEKEWKISQPFPDNKEVMIVEGKYVNEDSDSVDIKSIRGGGGEDDGLKEIKQNKKSRKLMELEPGELGRSLEHMLGYYYVQEIASMLPVIALSPKPGELILDLAASPGSKTTQTASFMENKGTIIANDISLDRIKILASNLERCGVMNAIITKKEGSVLCDRLGKQGFKFDKILVDAPCSGEGTLRSSPKTYKIWNINTVKKLSKIQKNLLSSALEILKPGGEIVYSTCTHAPEENEEVVDNILREFGDKIRIEKISLPIKCRQGITQWQDKKYNSEIKKSCRIYPQDNNTEGFFIVKLKKIK